MIRTATTHYLLQCPTRHPLPHRHEDRHPRTPLTPRFQSHHRPGPPIPRAPRPFPHPPTSASRTTALIAACMPASGGGTATCTPPACSTSGMWVISPCPLMTTLPPAPPTLRQQSATWSLVTIEVRACSKLTQHGVVNLAECWKEVITWTAEYFLTMRSLQAHASLHLNDRAASFLPGPPLPYDAQKRHTAMCRNLHACTASNVLLPWQMSGSHGLPAA